MLVPAADTVGYVVPPLRGSGALHQQSQNTDVYANSISLTPTKNRRGSG